MYLLVTKQRTGPVSSSLLETPNKSLSCHCVTQLELRNEEKSSLKSIIVLLALFILFAARMSMAGEYYDAQGDKIVKVLRQEFPIPIDKATFPPIKGAYWKPWSYWKSLHKEHSSEILIYGVKDKYIQDRIIESINALREKKILVRFYDDSRFDGHYDEKGNGGTNRLETPILRQETLE